MALSNPVGSLGLMIAPESTYGTTPAAATGWIRADPGALPELDADIQRHGRTATGKPYEMGAMVQQGLKSVAFPTTGPITATAAHWLLAGLIQSAIPTPSGNVYTWNADYTAHTCIRAASVGFVGSEGTEWNAALGAVPTSVTFKFASMKDGGLGTWSADWLARNTARTTKPTAATIDALDPIWTSSVAATFTTPALASCQVLDFSITLKAGHALRPGTAQLQGKPQMGQIDITGEMTLMYGTVGGVSVNEEARDFLSRWESWSTYYGTAALADAGTIAFGATGNKITFTPRFFLSGKPSWVTVNNIRCVKFPFECGGTSAAQALAILVDNGAATFAWASMS